MAEQKDPPEARAEDSLKPWPSSIAERNEAEACSGCKRMWVLRGPCSPWCAGTKYKRSDKCEPHPDLDAEAAEPNPGGVAERVTVAQARDALHRTWTAGDDCKRVLRRYIDQQEQSEREVAELRTQRDKWRDEAMECRRVIGRILDSGAPMQGGISIDSVLGNLTAHVEHLRELREPQQSYSDSPAKLGGPVDALDRAESALDRFLKEPHAPSEDALYDAIRWVLAAVRGGKADG